MTSLIRKNGKWEKNVCVAYVGKNGNNSQKLFPAQKKHFITSLPHCVILGKSGNELF